MLNYVPVFPQSTFQDGINSRIFFSNILSISLHYTFSTMPVHNALPGVGGQRGLPIDIQISPALVIVATTSPWDTIQALPSIVRWQMKY